MAFFTFTVTPAWADAVIKPSTTYQKIEGFGASSAWTAPMMQSSDADLAFDPVKGVGLSLLRVRVAPCQTTTPTCVLTCGEVATAQAAQARGARIWATPWTPPVAWKLNYTPDAGLDNGMLDPAHADDWANALVAFVQWMAAPPNNINLIGLSAQNEPDMGKTSYESCSYTSAALTDFIANHLGPAFANAQMADAGSALPFKLIGPETVDWTDIPKYGTSILNSNGAQYMGVIASHDYGTSLPLANPAPAGVEYWETEVYPQSIPKADLTMTSGLWVAERMHNALVIGGVNAWHYWWLYPTGPDNQGLWDQATNSPTKRLYVMGNYSKFVRPGFVRASATSDTSTGVEVSAYVGPANSNAIVVVAINPNTNDVPQSFGFDGAETGQWSAWVTSPSDNLAQQSDSISDGNKFTYTLKAQSVTTFTGVVTGPGPAYVPPPVSSSTASSGSGATARTPQGNSGLACTASPQTIGGGRGTMAGLLAGGLAGLIAFGRRRRRSAARSV